MLRHLLPHGRIVDEVEIERVFFLNRVLAAVVGCVELDPLKSDDVVEEIEFSVISVKTGGAKPLLIVPRISSYMPIKNSSYETSLT